MILGLGNNKPPVKAPAPAAGAEIFDVNTENFEQAVVMASMEAPVLVDFWAP